MAARGLACAMASMSLRTPQHAQARSGLQHAEQSYAAPTSHKWQCAPLSARRSSVCAGQALQSSNASAQAGRIEVCAVECKLKTRKAAAKRYKITGSGKVFTRRPGKQHINEKKSPKRLRALGKEKEIDHGDKRKVVRCLPYAKIK